jgi:hypothetical protein
MEAERKNGSRTDSRKGRTGLSSYVYGAGDGGGVALPPISTLEILKHGCESGPRAGEGATLQGLRQGLQLRMLPDLVSSGGQTMRKKIRCALEDDF